MGDRELLELAAKAAGAVRTESGELYVPNGPDGKTLFLLGWNPLEDDGDALRLAVKLKMPITFGQTQPTTGCWQEMEHYGNGDPYAATRRAIVRAAAEIGRTDDEDKEGL